MTSQFNQTSTLNSKPTKIACSDASLAITTGIFGENALKDEDILTTPSSLSPIIIHPCSTPPSRSYSSIVDGSHSQFSWTGELSSVPHGSCVATGFPEKPEAKDNPSKQFKRQEELNWFDYAELKSNGNLFSPEDRKFLRDLENKRTKYSKGFENGNYFENVYPVVSSHFHKAKKMTYCGNFINGVPAPCRLWSLCSKCAYTKGMQFSQMYSPGFDKTHFFHLTCSFDGKLSFDATNCVLVQDYWDAVTKSLRTMISEGWIDGAHIVHELKLHQFHPVRVTPHSHIVITGDAIVPGFQGRLVELLSKCEGVALTPSIHIDLLEHQRDLDRVLKYQTKAIELKEPYDVAWKSSAGDNRKDVIPLNLEMKQFLDSFGAALNQFKRIVRIGNLYGSSKSYLGIKKDDIPNPKRRKSPKKKRTSKKAQKRTQKR